MPTDHKYHNVGQMLKARRQAMRVSMAQVEMDTKIRGKFLAALESGDYSTLPNDIYSRGFVQHYANHLGLNGSEVASDYADERGGVEKGDTKRPTLKKPVRFVFTPRIFAVVAVLLLALGILWYLLWQYSVLAAAPSLEVTSPDSDRVLAGAVIDVSGHSTPGTDVTVNDSPVLTGTDGEFSEKVALQDGVNPIRVTARSKLGKSTTILRNVLAKIPKMDAASAAVPAAVFDGVAVAVKVKDATSVVVMVDGVEAWRGTVVSGWSKVFTGTKDISITTGNAGVTSLTVTNAVAAEKSLSPLGKDGEIRRNQSFAKDTVIP